MHGHTHGHDHPHDQEGARAPATTLTPPLVHLPPAEQVTHAVPGETAEPARRSRLSIAVMGLVGGLVPSPSALVLLLAAVALGRAWFGVVLVVAFGVGMAASLAFVGLVARDLFVRVEGWARRRGRVTAPVRLALTYGAASGVCVVGTVIVLRAVMAVA